MSPVPVPAVAKVPVPDARLVLYSAVSAALQVLAPAHFDCQATVGADGSTSLTVWSPASTSATITKGGVSAVVYPACSSCTLEFACPFFSSAAEALKRAGYPPCAAQPPKQVVHEVNAYTVSFSDPPGTDEPRGSEALVPSDSADPTDGVAIYGAYTYGKYRDDVAVGAACVLPADEHATCVAVLNQFRLAQPKRFLGLSAAP